MFILMTNLRGWPAGHDAGLYFNRKGWKALITLIFAGLDYRIRHCTKHTWFLPRLYDLQPVNDEALLGKQSSKNSSSR